MNTELPMPRDQRPRAPTLSQAVQELPQPQQRQRSALAERLDAINGRQQSQQQTQGDERGGRQGGQERPSHSSYYQPVPAGEMAPPQPDRRHRGWER